jgi:hypothetical protein
MVLAPGAAAVPAGMRMQLPASAVRAFDENFPAAGSPAAQHRMQRPGLPWKKSMRVFPFEGGKVFPYYVFHFHGRLPRVDIHAVHN